MNSTVCTRTIALVLNFVTTVVAFSEHVANGFVGNLTALITVFEQLFDANIQITVIKFVRYVPPEGAKIPSFLKDAVEKAKRSEKLSEFWSSPACLVELHITRHWPCIGTSHKMR